MKKIINILVYLGFFLAGLTHAGAQHIYNGRISMPGELTKSGDQLTLHMTIDYSQLELERNQGVTLTPVLVGERVQVAFPSVMFNGKVRDKVYSRALVLDDDTRNQSQKYKAVLNTHSKYQQAYTYHESIPYQSWMDNARLDLIEDLDGCSGNRRELIVRDIATIVSQEWEASPAYIQPDVEAVKKRNEQFEAYLEFHVARTEIIPDFRNNRAELNTLENGINSIRDDRNLDVTDIAITGYASPEGSVSLNDRLSQGRADAMRSYLAGKYSFPPRVYRVEKGGEDWVKLESLVSESSGLQAKDEILDIIRNTADQTARQDKLTILQGGAPYRQLLKDYYPQLRRVVAVVHYTVRGFDLDEAKEVIKRNPRQLSLEEMYRIANSYPAGSQAFNQTFDTAVKTFPTDKTANLNAAAVALGQKDTATARRYLDNADKTTAEYNNNLGMLYVLENDYVNAEAAFNRAAQMGSLVAGNNLELLKQSQQSNYILNY